MTAESNSMFSNPTTLQSLWQLVGNTPMVSITYRYRGGPEQHILVKCEHYNLTGSIKDRMALYILQKAYNLDHIRPADTIIEATSGNTGISFAAIGKALGHRVRIYMPDWLSSERADIIRSLGAEVRLVSKAEGGFLGCIRLAEESLKEGNIFLPKQFENCFNAEAHARTTGPEISHQLNRHRTQAAAFVAGVGTGGTIMGVGSYLRSVFPSMKVRPVEPAESPTLSTGYKIGSHRIQGISDEFIPSIINLEKLDKVVQVNDGDSILMAQKLASELGLAVGISSGANLLASIKVQQEMGRNASVVTIFPDSNKKYLSTDLFQNEPLKAVYLTPDITLTGYCALMK